MGETVTANAVLDAVDQLSLSEIVRLVEKLVSQIERGLHEIEVEQTGRDGSTPIAEELEHLRETLQGLEHLRGTLEIVRGTPRRSLRGLWRGLDVTGEEIDEARREMWGSFPRSDI